MAGTYPSGRAAIAVCRARDTNGVYSWSVERLGLSAVHVHEEFGGQGAESVATCIVIEEVARVCASSSLIPAVNKLGTMGLILSGSDDLKKQVLPAIGSGEAMASYRAGCVGRGDRIHQGSQAVRQVDQRVPGCAVHARRYGDEGGGGCG